MDELMSKLEREVSAEKVFGAGNLYFFFIFGGDLVIYLFSF